MRMRSRRSAQLARWLLSALALSLASLSLTPLAEAQQPVSLTVHLEDGRVLRITQPEIVQKTNPGFVPARYGRTDTIVFSKWSGPPGATKQEQRLIKLAAIWAIEYTRNTLNECVTLIHLRDGSVLAFEGSTNFDRSGPSHTLERLPKDFFDRFSATTLRTDYRDYRAETGAVDDATYHLRGRLGERDFGDDAGDLFACPSSMRTGSTDNFIKMRRLEFAWPTQK